MGTCICSCGAKYRFATGASGKKARCKRCGSDLTLDESPARVPQPAVAGNPPFHVPEPIIETIADDEEATPLVQRRLESGYWRELFWSLLFPSSMHNLVAFLTLWGVYGFLTCLPRLSFFYILAFFWVAVWLWLIAFKMGVIEATATGQYQLPDVEISGNVLVDLLDPAMRWIGSWLVVLTPALIYSIAQGYRGVNVIADTWTAIMSPPLPGTPGPVVDATLASLTIVGLFFWPLVLLAVLFGGYGSLWRVDLFLISLGSTFIPYVITLMIVAVAYGGYALSELYLSQSLWSIFSAGTVSGLFSGILQRVLATGIELYTGIVIARAIGLFFRHFGHRLAWDWGQKPD